MTTNNINRYNDPEGQIYAIVGKGDVNFHSLDGKSSFIASQQASRFGHLNIDLIKDVTIMVGKFISNEGGIMDQFTITKSTSSSPAEEIWNNGTDYGGDGLIDSQDPNCHSQGTGYHYEPFLTRNSHNHVVSIPSTQNLQLSKFIVAEWFKTTSHFGHEAIIVNKGRHGTDSSGQNMNYGIWMTSSQKIQGGLETSDSTDRWVTSPKFI